MVLLQYDYRRTAELIDNSLDMFGIKSAFNFFGINKEKWIKNNDPYSIKPIYISPGTYFYPPK